jgi:hypothetical protein
MLATLVVACGGSEFSSVGADGGGQTSGDSAETPPDHDATVTDDSGDTRDAASVPDARDPHDASETHDASGVHDASGGDDSGGGAHDAASESGTGGGGDADTCTGTGQCDSTHPCPMIGTHLGTCCTPIILGKACGTCSDGICPG